MDVNVVQLLVQNKLVQYGRQQKVQEKCVTFSITGWDLNQHCKEILS
jgi:hypothetical protein